MSCNNENQYKVKQNNDGKWYVYTKGITAYDVNPPKVKLGRLACDKAFKTQRDAEIHADTMEKAYRILHRV
jgi:hypothetical protein